MPSYYFLQLNYQKLTNRVNSKHSDHSLLFELSKKQATSSSYCPNISYIKHCKQLRVWASDSANISYSLTYILFSRINCTLLTGTLLSGEGVNRLTSILHMKDDLLMIFFYHPHTTVLNQKHLESKNLKDQSQ